MNNFFVESNEQLHSLKIFTELKQIQAKVAAKIGNTCFTLEN